MYYLFIDRSLGLGLGVGVKINYINSQIKQSISLTDKEASIVSNATDVWTESWILNNRKYDFENNVWTATVATRNKKGEVIDTGIKVFSSNKLDDNEQNKSSEIWSSKSYQNEAMEVENKKNK